MRRERARRGRSAEKSAFGLTRNEKPKSPRRSSPHDVDATVGGLLSLAAGDEGSNAFELVATSSEQRLAQERGFERLVSALVATSSEGLLRSTRTEEELAELRRALGARVLGSRS